MRVPDLYAENFDIFTSRPSKSGFEKGKQLLGKLGGYPYLSGVSRMGHPLRYLPPR